MKQALPTSALKTSMIKNLIFFRLPFKTQTLIKEKLFLKTFLLKTAFLLLTSHTKFLRTKIFSSFNSIWKKQEVFNYIKGTPPFLNHKNKELFFSKYYYNGLGYKIFVRDKYLFIWIGLTHYTVLEIPSNIKIFTKKKRIFLVGTNLLKFNEFLMAIRRVRKIDLYKGKGILEVKSYKGFIKMKSGKKKQY